MAEESSIPDQPNLLNESAGGVDLLIGVSIVWGFELSLGALLGICLGRSAELPINVLLATLVSGLVTALVTWHLVCWNYEKSFTEGFRITRPTKNSVLRAVLIGLVLAVAAAVLAGHFSTGKHFFVRMVSKPGGMTCFVLLALLLPPLEEMYYRGFLFPIIEKRLGAVPAVLIVIVWFGAAHALQSLDDLIAVPIVVVLGSVLTIQRHVTGSLTASLVTHWSYNLCAVTMGLLTGFKS